MKSLLIYGTSFYLFILLGCSYEYQDRQLMKKLQCRKKYEMSVDERKNHIQFKDSPKIAFVSFKKSSSEIETYDLQLYFKEVKKDYSKFNLNDFHEVKFLNTIDTENFSDLIYNYGINKETLEGYTIMCYQPHNAVLYLNEDNTLKGFIEICFNCEKNYSSNPEVYNLGEYCYTKLKMLKEQFINSGVNYVGGK